MTDGRMKDAAIDARETEHHTAHDHALLTDVAWGEVVDGDGEEKW